VAFLADALVTVVVSLMTKPKPVGELQGLVWGMANVDEGALRSDRVWYRSPGLLAGGILALTVGASLLFI
jgi:SSS family solute:Na+ symporter